MEAGIHLPLIDLDGAGFSAGRLAGTVDAARDCGFAAVSANDHLLFPAPWLDGLTALAAVAGRAGPLELMTSLALPALRGPAWLAKALAALDLLSGGRVVAGVGPGSSRADYAASGVPFADRWARFDESVELLRASCMATDYRRRPGARHPDAALHPARLRRAAGRPRLPVERRRG